MDSRKREAALKLLGPHSVVISQSGYDYVMALRGALSECLNHIADTEMALSKLLRRYKGLADSGDAGFWDCETEAEVIDARRVLGQQKKEAESATQE